jgi:CHASE2 domain
MTFNYSKSLKKQRGLILLLTGIFVFALFFSLKRTPRNKKTTVEIANTIDDNIILINAGEGNRESISKLLLSVDSCRPLVIAIDALFLNEKTSSEDSILESTLKWIHGDILTFNLNSNAPVRSLQRFIQFASGEGYTDIEKKQGLASHFVPLKKNDNQIYESFALRIVRTWKPEFKHSIKENESIPIKYTRTLGQYINFDNIDLENKEARDYIKGKIILIGYLGPSNEDKHFTPIRFIKEYPEDEPDTYGLVIIANEIRTILEYEKKY